MAKKYIHHGLEGCKLQKILYAIRNRCQKKENSYYKNYGGRGIRVCEEWSCGGQGFINFYNWAMKNGYKDGLTIDRINNNGNYEPSNCRWVDMKTQSRNRRTNRWIKYNGETHILTDWFAIINLPPRCIYHRIERGWNIKKAFETPLMRRKK